MALVRTLQRVNLDRPFVHDEVECTCTVFQDVHGQTYIQLDTYGSKRRQIPGKKSQSLQLSPEAVKELLGIIRENF
jgi:hypothetical protein